MIKALFYHEWRQQGQVFQSEPLSAFLLLVIAETIVVCADKMFNGI